MGSLEEELEKLRVEVENCRRCPLHRGRNKPVLGEGPAPARIMLVGEAPGYWEDRQGRPFVGAAGKFLNELLAEAGLKREEVYITNVVKCRPPGNRDPKPEEEEACAPYLERQLSLLRPSLICTLGSHATARILTHFGLKPQPITRIHGKAFKAGSLLGEVTIIPLFHPASALYKPPMRSLQLEDWRRVGGLLAELGLKP
ncbi:MAG: uracil-DNA glycosylase [Candidatus Hecatellales archaeon]|nr:MAG: uracil-DNA glycosylase [Candidatus Hecatellales archaeon]